jgi:nitrogen fixation/metabolism regulation signal transduction histidine kinase
LIADRTDNDSLREFARGIVEEGNRVAVIVKNLLSFSRQQKESHSPARVADIVAATLSLVGAALRKDGIDVQVEIPADLPSIKCRSQQIQQVLLNLLTNARDGLNERYSGLDGCESLSKITASALPPLCWGGCSIRSSPPSRATRAPGSDSPSATGSRAITTGR